MGAFRVYEAGEGAARDVEQIIDGASQNTGFLRLSDALGDLGDDGGGEAGDARAHVAHRLAGPQMLAQFGQGQQAAHMRAVKPETERDAPLLEAGTEIFRPVDWIEHCDPAA